MLGNLTEIYPNRRASLRPKCKSDEISQTKSQKAIPKEKIEKRNNCNKNTSNEEDEVEHDVGDYVLCSWCAAGVCNYTDTARERSFWPNYALGQLEEQTTMKTMSRTTPIFVSSVCVQAQSMPMLWKTRELAGN